MCIYVYMYMSQHTHIYIYIYTYIYTYIYIYIHIHIHIHIHIDSNAFFAHWNTEPPCHPYSKPSRAKISSLTSTCMVERLPWLILGATHLVRSLIEDSGKKELKLELSHLRVEIHRTKDLLQDYRAVLEGCEKELHTVKSSSGRFCLGNLILGVVCVALWVVWRFQTTARSDIGPGVTAEVAGPLVVAPVAKKRGPRRPSDLAERGV